MGLYVAVMADGDASANGAHLGFESLSGAIHFSGETLDARDIGPVVRSLRGGKGWERRMLNASFDPVADGWLGPRKKRTMRPAGSLSGPIPPMPEPIPGGLVRGARPAVAASLSGS